MVFHKRLDYGYSGYQVPPMPRVPSSARGKRSARRKAEEKPMCAFDMLATVAGELLSERENGLLLHKDGGTSVPAITKGVIKKENISHEKPFKAEVFDQGSCNESALGSEKQVRYDPKECSLSPRTAGKDAREPVLSCKISEFGTPKKIRKEECSPALKVTCKSEDGIKTPFQGERRMFDNVVSGTGPEIFEDLMDVDAKPLALVSSASSVKVPIPRNPTFAKCSKGITVDGDDDENSSGCTNPRINTSKTFRPQCPSDHRIRKLFASKFWKVAPNDGELSNTEMKAIYRNRKLCYTREKTERCSFKRRKLFERRSISASNLDIYDEGVSPKLGCIKMEASDKHANLNAANGASSSTSGQKSSYESRDYHVKLNIKSFKVPELVIEIPENATVGSLKRTVMEAVTAILGSGLCVGVFHQGKKVRDDNKTLLQAGISHNDKVENLGFTLEPSYTLTPPSLLCPEDPNSIISSDTTEQLKIRIPDTPTTLELPAASDVTPKAPETLSSNCPESDHDSVPSPTDASSVDKTAYSKALLPVPSMNDALAVPVPSVNVDALAMVPLRKSRRTEQVQRRIRRPFSVSEVEALVQAVEKLGTGRWRDVKLRAFDNAKHRTYVDLKDKWKTLVHTARISPQQRRGEPVPQELLDRVLSAHAYWSSQQTKLQAKPLAEACLLA
ncbi:telomere repeat-binding protein 2-like isoform X1 [Iris pallida]|uniref:Telomere repeat-binding protein 2-like isoform X1 n=1 Tax=Iris pallida TaxID=29817 RepID=A0AAX6ERZ2_IRIPA|nr:telomere repeat-binding protein 2-like isoform X1 [Iris pallida]